MSNPMKLFSPSSTKDYGISQHSLDRAMHVSTFGAHVVKEAALPVP